MPILYKSTERVLFAHIPKTAGTSLYVWFAENGWLVANLRLLETIGTGVEFRKRFGITQCQMEGRLPAEVSPQHATKDYFCDWKEFTSQFCIVRHPLTRYLSELNYLFSGFCRQRKIRHANNQVIADYIQFYNQNNFSAEFHKKRSLLDNHVRPQVDFITEEMSVLYFEGDWQGWLKRAFGLKEQAKAFNVSNKVIRLQHLSGEMEEQVYRFYKEDYDRLGYPRNSADVLAF